MRHPKTLLSRLLPPVVIALSAVMLLGACGQKGRLYLADDPPPSQVAPQATSPSATESASPVPEEDLQVPGTDPDKEPENESNDGTAP